jgi:hypothetical protein
VKLYEIGRVSVARLQNLVGVLCPPQASTCERLFAVFAIERFQVAAKPCMQVWSLTCVYVFMKSLRFLPFLFAFPLLSLAETPVPLSNQHVILLVESGLRPSEVVRLIGAAPAVNFDLTPSGTDRLLRAGVCEETIKQMAAREILGRFYQRDDPRTTPDYPVRRRTASSQSDADRGVDDPGQDLAEAFRLPGGTPVRLRLNQGLSSADARTGDTIYFQVLDDVKVPHYPYIVINRGATAVGTIIDGEQKRTMGRAGKLKVRVDFVRLADGDKLALTGSDKNFPRHGHVGAMVGAMVATSVVYAPATPLFLFIHGKDSTADEGQEILAMTNGDANLDVRYFR